MKPIVLDGSQGEGGGQILRTSLALSLTGGQPIRIENIRSKRSRPGLMRQHLTAVLAAAAVGDADVTGAEIGSTELTFEPRALAGGDYHWSIGTAGSTTLVFQTVLPALLAADRPSRVVLEGGTHNPFAPPFDFLEQAYLPILRRMGAEVSLTLERPGFFPAGGGRWVAEITPIGTWQPIELLERGETRPLRGRVWLSGLPKSIADRETRALVDKLPIETDAIEVKQVEEPRGPGNCLQLAIESDAVTEVMTAFGAAGTPSERVAGELAKEARSYLAADAPVGQYLADQLLLPFALAKGGSFRSIASTLHAKTHIEILQAFLPCTIEEERRGRSDHRFTVN